MSETVAVDRYTTLPAWLWAAGAAAVGQYHPADRTRCTACGRWTRTPAWYGQPNPTGGWAETERVLCSRHHAPLVAKALAFINQRTHP